MNQRAKNANKRKKAKQNKRARLEKAFNEQHGLCWWCLLPMNLKDTNDSKFDQTDATYEHLEPRPVIKGGHYMRKYVAAHRLCNNERGHEENITLKTLKKIYNIFNIKAVEKEP